jgi:hypothetical protein
MIRLLSVFALVLSLFVMSHASVSQEAHDYRYAFYGFADYAVGVPNIPYPKMPKLKRGDQYFERRAAIKASAAEPINFAGHLKVVAWGCGTQCQQGVIIDMLTGELHELPGSAAGYSYYIDSALLVTNTYNDPNEEPPDWMKQRFYYWDGEQLVFIKEKKPPVADGGE